MDQIVYSLWFHQDWRLYTVMSAAPMFIAAILIIISRIRATVGTAVLRRSIRTGPHATSPPHRRRGAVYLRFGRTTVHVHPKGVRTTLRDGTIVLGAPEDTDDYRATAARCGYGDDTLQLCKDHEVLHAALSHWLGLGESPTLRAVASDSGATDITRLEEAAVLAVQQFARAAGADLLCFSLQDDAIDPC